MREEIVQGLRREDEAARQQREREHQEELQRNRDQILADLRVQANQAEFQRRQERDAVRVRVTRTGVCYHLEHCPRLRHHRDNQLRHMSRGEAVARGYRECDQCRGRVGLSYLLRK